MDSTFHVKTTVRKIVSRAMSVLSTSADCAELCKVLENVGQFLPTQEKSKGKGEDQQFTKTSSSSNDTLDLLCEISPSDLMAARQEFCHTQYVRFLEFLCSQLSLEWYGRFGREQSGNHLFDRFFLEGIPQDSLLVLCSVIQNCSPSFKQKKCALLLEEFFRSHQLQKMLCSLCDVLPSSAASPRSLTLQTQWDQVTTLLVTLPDRMANKLKTECSEFFHPNQYISMIAEEILQALHHVHQKLFSSQDCSLQFVSHLIGRLCLHGHTERFHNVLLPHLIRFSSSDFIWARIANRVLAGAPERSLENILEHLLRKTTWYGSLSRLLGDSVLTNTKIHFLLTNKFLLLRHYDDSIVPQNLIGYLAHSPTRRHLVLKVLQSVLETWGDGSAVKHTSHTQHFYLTKVIVICVGHLNAEEKKKHKGDLMMRLMGGVQAHLESPILRLRRLGMVGAEVVATTLDPDGPKLKFEYEEDEESRLLWSLVHPPEDPGVETVVEEVRSVSLDGGDHSSSHEEKSNVPEESNKSSQIAAEGDEELDSDDEFEPYNMSHDTKVTKVKIPVYIRDCMDGLIAKENPELTEASLRVAEKLIRAKPDDLQDVCSQFSAILLHLDDHYSTENFRFLRHSAMVALAVQCPVEVTVYLTQEFYNRNYNIRQRMDVLEVLVAAAQELSRPIEEPAPVPEKKRSVEIVKHSTKRAPDDETTENWREIVQRRIESKTRRFAKGPSKPAACPAANRFAPVAGHFFFPLMKAYDRKMNTMDLLGGDFLLLAKMVYTLGVIIYAAQNAPVCRQMASSLLELIWSLRYHTEQFVRQSLMFAVSMVTLSVPSHLLVTDLQNDIMECRLWLQDIEQDPEPECKALAAQTMMVIDSTIQKELKTET